MELTKKLFVKVANEDREEGQYLDAYSSLEEAVGVTGEEVVEIGEYELVRKFKASGKIVVEELKK